MISSLKALASASLKSFCSAIPNSWAFMPSNSCWTVNSIKVCKAKVGCDEGAPDGCVVGCPVGDLEGCVVGCPDGNEDG